MYLYFSRMPDNPKHTFEDFTFLTFSASTEISKLNDNTTFHLQNKQLEQSTIDSIVQHLKRIGANKKYLNTKNTITLTYDDIKKIPYFILSDFHLGHNLLTILFERMIKNNQPYITYSEPHVFLAPKRFGKHQQKMQYPVLTTPHSRPTLAENHPLQLNPEIEKTIVYQINKLSNLLQKNSKSRAALRDILVLLSFTRASMTNDGRRNIEIKIGNILSFNKIVYEEYIAVMAIVNTLLYHVIKGDSSETNKARIYDVNLLLDRTYVMTIGRYLHELLKKEFTSNQFALQTKQDWFNYHDRFEDLYALALTAESVNVDDNDEALLSLPAPLLHAKANHKKRNEMSTSGLEKSIPKRLYFSNYQTDWGQVLRNPGKSLR